MDEALVYTSPNGPFKKKITALQIKSKEHYLELFPLISADTHEPVTWVKSSFKNGVLTRKSHFRTLSGKRKLYFVNYSNFICRQEKIVQTPEDTKAVNLLQNLLLKLLNGTKILNWSFRDAGISDFYFKGNILFNAISICKEFKIGTAFNRDFRLDIAVVGDDIKGKPLVVFGIEVEKGHQFNGLKTILCKTLGFPFISVDISGMTQDEISPEWAESVLALTTRDNKMGFRKNFIYLPPLLYPFYIRHDGHILRLGKRHCYTVFANHQDMQCIKEELNDIRSILKYSSVDINIAIVNGDKSKQALYQVELERKYVGCGWKQSQANQCLRISLPRPIKKDGISKLHKFYILLTKCLLSNNALVGYKYNLGLQSAYLNESDECCTVYEETQRPGKKNKAVLRKYLPRLLSSPLIEVAKKLCLF